MRVREAVFVTKNEMDKQTMRLTGYAEAMRDLRALAAAGFDLDGSIEGLRVHLVQRTEVVKAMASELNNREAV